MDFDSSESTTFGSASTVDWALKAAQMEDMLSKITFSEMEAQDALNKKRFDNLKWLYDQEKQLAEEQAAFAADLETIVREESVKQRLDNERAYQEEAKRLYLERVAVMREAEGELSEERIKQIQEECKIEAKAKVDAENTKKKREAGKAQSIEKFNAMFAAGATPKERLAAVKDMAKGPDGENSFKAFVGNMTAGLANLAKQLESKMDEVGKHKTPIDTRLYGSETNSKFLGSYFDKMSQTFTGIAGASPFILQADLITSLEKLVEKGISYNVQQRAFLDTVAGKIATTFEVTDGTLLKLVRIQQADTTAARLGMESALNAFLNSMYETTEYLSELADSVRSGLYEAQALMEADVATEFEYQVQKWLGSMYSVGMSDSAVTAISTALGQLAAGELEGITNGGIGNLLVMAANQTGLSISKILEDGLNGEDTNQLLSAAVEYLGEIAAQSDSKVIQQQLAGVFGIKASDLKAIANLRTDETIKQLTESTLNYGDMITELNSRANTMYQRVSIGEMMSNVWENVQYSMAAGMANNPITYLLYKVGGLLEQTTGGIDLPFLNVYGFGVDLNTTVAQLMQAGAMAGGILSSLGNMIAGISAGGGFSGSGMLKALGVSNSLDIIERGTALSTIGKAQSGASVSESGSGTTGNGSASDIQNATMAQAADDKASMLQQGTEEFDKDATNTDIVNALGEAAEITKEGLAEIVYGLQALASALGTDAGIIGGFTGNAGINKNFGG